MKFVKSSLIILCVTLTAAGCNKSGEHQNGSHNDGSGGNQALYEEVMDIHDEVMPKMNDLYKAKTTLQTRLAMPGTSETERQEIDNKIALLDSAGDGMMVWMRQFNPLPDSLGEVEARQYLEKELVKVKKVKENILAALEKTGTTN